MTNLFGNALQRVIQKRDATRGGSSRFAETAGIKQYNLSRYTTGKQRPDIDDLELICQALDEHDRSDVVEAYLLDDIPPSARDLIRIIKILDQGKTERIAETPALKNPLDALPKKKREVMEFLIREVAESEVSFEALEATYNLMRHGR